MFDVAERVRWLAIDWGFWKEWNFSEGCESVATCDVCAGSDSAHLDWQKAIYRWFFRVERLQMVVNGGILDVHEPHEISFDGEPGEFQLLWDEYKEQAEHDLNMAKSWVGERDQRTSPIEVVIVRAIEGGKM